MKRLAMKVLLCSMTLLAVPSLASGPTLLFDYVGYDYESPDPNPATFGEAGSGYIGVGFVPNIFVPLVADTVNNEYTYQMSGLTVTSNTPVGTYQIITYSVGTLSIYEDDKGTGTPGNYASPGTFSDGTLFLTGTLSGFQIVVNTATQSGSFDATYMATGGSQIGNIPLNQRDGWTFAGITGNEIDAPPGYYHQVDGQVFLDKPVPVENTTWGHIKSRSR